MKGRIKGERQWEDRGESQYEKELDGQRRRGKEQSPHITFHEYVKCTREMLYEGFHKSYLA